MAEYTTNDIDAVLDYLDAQCRPGYRKALTALVAERDKAKADFSDAWRERCEFARRIDEADGAIFAVVAERDRLKQRVAELEAQPPASDLRERLVESALQGAARDAHMHHEASSMGTRAVYIVDAAIAAMRKGDSDAK